MGWTVTPWDALAVVDGGLIVALGAFVLAAHPTGEVNRAFFALALADGASTVFYQLRWMTDDAFLRLAFMEWYWVTFLAFVGLLAAFGLLFPRPVLPRLSSRAFWTLTVGVTVAVVAAFALWPGAFWRYAVGADGASFQYAAAGRLALAAFLAATGIIVFRLARTVVKGREPSHRKQAAFVLAGMSLAYVPYPVTALAFAAEDGLASYLFSPRWDTALAYWCYVALVVLAAAGLGLAARARTPERTFVRGALAGVAVLAAVSVLLPQRGVQDAVALLGLLAYPLLLGYAIVRYEVFDIDAKVRRAAFVSLVGVALAGLFTMAGALAENLLQDRIDSVAGLSVVSAVVAAGVTSLAFGPITRNVRRAMTRIVPELTVDELHARKLEVYRHSLSGAHADGILTTGESRTLQALREALGISGEEHERLYAEVTRQAAS